MAGFFSQRATKPQVEPQTKPEPSNESQVDNKENKCDLSPCSFKAFCTDPLTVTTCTKTPLTLPSICPDGYKKFEKVQRRGYRTRKSEDKMCISNFQEDGLHILKSGITIQNSLIIDSKPAYVEGGHRDGIQLIPTEEGYGQIHFAGGELNNVIIKNNTIVSESSGNITLQGIFASDGRFNNINVTCNVVQTNAENYRKIAINGVMSGTICNNFDKNGKRIIADLNPLRLGGGGGVYINSFVRKKDNNKYEKYSYGHINGSNGIDYNYKRNNPKGLENFDYDSFLHDYKNSYDGKIEKLKKEKYDEIFKKSGKARKKLEKLKKDEDPKPIQQEIAEYTKQLAKINSDMSGLLIIHSHSWIANNAENYVISKDKII